MATGTAKVMVMGVPATIDMMRLLAMAVGAASLLTATAQAHDAPNLDHTHAFQQSAYGSYRQGHQVSGRRGDIIVWSARKYTGYQQAPVVRFARPQPITRAPGGAAPKPGAGPRVSVPEYGARRQDEYGDR
jgi:hypothetical protein